MDYVQLVSFDTEGEGRGQAEYCELLENQNFVGLKKTKNL